MALWELTFWDAKVYEKLFILWFHTEQTDSQAMVMDVLNSIHYKKPIKFISALEMHLRWACMVVQNTVVGPRPYKKGSWESQRKKTSKQLSSLVPALVPIRDSCLDVPYPLGFPRWRTVSWKSKLQWPLPIPPHHQKFFGVNFFSQQQRCKTRTATRPISLMVAKMSNSQIRILYPSHWDTLVNNHLLHINIRNRCVPLFKNL